MTALLTNNLPLISRAPNGIQKLRELILELAVRGKLLAQNPCEEPAIELLDQIAKEKMQFVAKGKTSAHIPLVPIDDAKVPYKAPPGWLWIELGDISLIERGGSPRPIKDFLTEDPDGLNWIKIGDTDKGGKYITSAGEKIRHEGLVKTRMVYPGDFLLTNSMSFGRPYITKIEGCIHDGWLRISPPTSLVKDYLYLLLSSPYVRSFFIQAAAGAVVLNLNADKVRELPVPLPPLTEQQRIVAKVDELMALCDRLEAQQADAESAHARLVQTLLDSLTQASDATDFAASWQRLAEHFHTLFTTESSIDALKQNLLQLTVMGKLGTQDSSDEPASELLKRIVEEMAQSAMKKKTGNQIPMVTMREAQTPYKSAPGWLWIKLGDISLIERGGSPRPIKDFLTEDPDGINWIKIGDTDKGGKYITSTGEKIRREGLTRTRMVYPGDFLLTNSMSFGRPYITQIEGCIHDGWLRISPPATLVKDYLYLLLSSPYVRSFFVGAASGAVVLNLNADKVRELPVPLPPLAEQHRIVAKVDQLMTLCDQLKNRLTQARQLNEQLASTLVEQAVA
ncbi:restriction endonuclease subunit S [Pseudomonas sp. LB3P81]